MRRAITIAITASVVGAGTIGLSAQGTPGASPPARPFLKLFSTPERVVEVPKALRDAFDERRLDRNRSDSLRDLPSGTRCDIIVVPADPRLDPRMTIVPPDPRQFSLRMVPTDRYCR